MARYRRQIISDALKIVLDMLQFTFDALQIRKRILGCLLRPVLGCSFVLRTVRDDGTSSEVGALIGVPYRRSLHEADGLFEVGLAREEVADRVPVDRHVFAAGHWHALVFQRVDKRRVDDVNRWSECFRCSRGGRFRHRRRRDCRRLRRRVCVVNRKHHDEHGGDSYYG